MTSRAASYAETSRLSFLGTWKTRLREIVSTELSNQLLDPVLEAELRAIEDESDPDNNFVLHIDVDCFFVSAARVSNPELHNIPIAVTSGGDNYSDICTASYEARRFGIKKGMLLSKARAQCPTLSIVRVSPEMFKLLNELTREMYKVFLQYSTDVYPLSCDELLMKVPKRYSKNVFESAKILRQAILTKTKCPVSIGIGLSSIMARQSTQFAKPPGTGIHQLHSLLDLPVRSLTGVGRVMEKKLTAMKITKCQHISQTDEKTLQKVIGSVLARKLLAMAAGQEASDIQFGAAAFLEQKPQSISRNLNWAVRPTERKDVDSIIKDVSTQVHQALTCIESNPTPQKVTLKLLIRAKDAPLPSKRFGHGLVTPWVSSSPYRLGIAETAIKVFHSFTGQVDQIRGVGVALHLKYKDEEEKRGVITLDRFLSTDDKRVKIKKKPVETLIIDDDDDDDDIHTSKEINFEETELFRSSLSSQNDDDFPQSDFASPTQFFSTQRSHVKRSKSDTQTTNEVKEVIDIDALSDNPKRRKPSSRRTRSKPEVVIL